MPGFDSTGPRGKGPMSGGGRGPCGRGQGVGQGRNITFAPGGGGGRGMGGGRGGGRGRGIAGGGRGMGGGGGCGMGGGSGMGRGMGRGMGAGMGGGMAAGGQGMGQAGTGRVINAQEQFKGGAQVAKIAITSEGPALTDMVDPRFGRAAGFVIVDLETMETQFLDNGGSQAMSQGAGIQAAENVANAGAGVVLTGYVGPKAFNALSAAGVKVGQGLENMTVGQAVEKYKRGEVEIAGSPNSQSGVNK